MVLQDDPRISSTVTAIERLDSDRFVCTPLLLGPLPLKRERPKWGSVRLNTRKGPLVTFLNPGGVVYTIGVVSGSLVYCFFA